MFTAEELVQLELAPLAAQMLLGPCITNIRYRKKIPRKILRRILKKIRKTVPKMITNREICIC